MVNLNNIKKNKRYIITYRFAVLSLLLLGVLFFAFFHIYFSPQRLFQINVSSDIKTIKNLKYYKDWDAMHGFFVFAFEADPQDIRNIIAKNALVRYKKIPEFVESLLIRIDKRSLPWWRTVSELEQMKIYGKEYNSKGEPHLKFIFTGKNGKVYYLQL